ncbi:MAG: methionine--tRNA ligase [Myxococcota bacterium]
MSEPQRCYVTTPIYYLNARPHIGHAYCTVATDTVARYRRLFGEEVYFLTGTDEHGQKVQEAADKGGVSPQEHVDTYSKAFRDLWPTLHIEHDDFIRTTEPRHSRVVKAALQQLFDDGDIYAKDYEGWYSTSAERFWTEKDLVDGCCPDTGQPVQKITERNYFFRMSKYGERLREHITTNPGFIHPPARANEVLGFLDKGLEDLCVSRPKARLTWGIELPFDSDYVTYVWFDALLNYISALGYGDEDSRFERWWPYAEHFIGKDILTTHSVYWTTMLLALGVSLPKRIIATGWWLQEDKKMSKSLGNVVSPLDMKDVYGADVLRYFLLRDMVLGLDSNFSEAALVRRNNSDLANDLGNLARRAAGLVGRYFDGKVPEPGELGDEEAPILAQVTALVAAVPTLVRELRLHEAIEETMQLVRRLNKYMTDTAPFKSVKTDPAAAARSLYTVMEGLRHAAVLLTPVMPQKMAELLDKMGGCEAPETLADLSWGQLVPGSPITLEKGLFPRAEMPKEEEPPAKTPTPKKKAAPAPKAPEGGASTIAFDDFLKVDLRVATVLACARVEGSEKLLRFQLEVGESQRQVVSGVAKHVDPDAVVGTQVIIVANLAPRKIFKIASEGMILTTETPEGGIALLRPGAEAPSGSQVT